MSTRPQLCAQLGMESQACSYPGALLVTSVPPVASSQVSGSRSNRRSPHAVDNPGGGALCRPVDSVRPLCTAPPVDNTLRIRVVTARRSEEHTSELQSRQYLVCRLLLEKKKQTSCLLC